MSIFDEFMAVLGEPMAIFGIVGQSVFFSRFLVQWIVSERNKESQIPLAFWYLSLGGASLTFIYAVWRRDPIFSIAQLFGLCVYTRNLMLIRASKRREAAAA